MITLGVSAEGIWTDAKTRPSGYFKWVDLDSEDVFHDFRLRHAKKPSLGLIIHEINECEVYDILKQWGIENKYIIPLKDKTIVFLHNSTDEVRISHIVSPYGLGGCAMPRYKFKARWR